MLLPSPLENQGMSLDKILSISGLPGLYKLLSRSKSGFIVESIEDKKRMMVNANQRISMISDISIYTSSEDKPLKDVLWSMKEKYGEQLPVNGKSVPDELKKFLAEVLPEYDRDRVYVSDIKKIVNWFFILKDIIEKEPEAEAEKKEVPEDKGDNPAKINS